jgi:hypothetical protein
MQNKYFHCLAVVLLLPLHANSQTASRIQHAVADGVPQSILLKLDYKLNSQLSNWLDTKGFPKTFQQSDFASAFNVTPVVEYGNTHFRTENKLCGEGAEGKFVGGGVERDRSSATLNLFVATNVINTKWLPQIVRKFGLPNDGPNGYKLIHHSNPVSVIFAGHPSCVYASVYYPHTVIETKVSGDRLGDALK